MISAVTGMISETFVFCIYPLRLDLFPVADCTRILVNMKSSYTRLPFGCPLL